MLSTLPVDEGVNGQKKRWAPDLVDTCTSCVVVVCQKEQVLISFNRRAPFAPQTNGRLEGILVTHHENIWNGQTLLKPF